MSAPVALRHRRLRYDRCFRCHSRHFKRSRLWLAVAHGRFSRAARMPRAYVCRCAAAAPVAVLPCIVGMAARTQVSPPFSP